MAMHGVAVAGPVSRLVPGMTVAITALPPHRGPQCEAIEDAEENVRPPGRQPGRPPGGVSDQSRHVTGRGFIGIADGSVELGDRADPQGRRILLHNWPGVGGLEAWIAGQRWKTAPGGWTVTDELLGWKSRIDVIAGGLRVNASAPSGRDPAVWVVTG
jgi:hypothetical protein